MDEERYTDMIRYKPLWDVMKKRRITTYNLEKRGIAPKTLQILRHDKNITMMTAGRLCRILNCSITEIVEFVEDRQGMGE
ncbi:helix-turn-helix transcriptional regulator [Ruminococcus sp. OA3]|uniref:helix-turn-helix domain-containing protein n=1 Tax=Ruminococcus sp. OA3 TaxID=2914164 RepID=UPI001F0540BC|nr:helix-turn-helix transcriptional regulator [Ruminococcus sp. OA3]MCH1984417.1 helix-turn-helix transcriptional regulator [Ruminococcus sp. OA3]